LQPPERDEIVQGKADQRIDANKQKNAKEVVAIHQLDHYREDNSSHQAHRGNQYKFYVLKGGDRSGKGKSGVCTIGKQIREQKAEHLRDWR
jgi:hypothetical protein